MARSTAQGSALVGGFVLVAMLILIVGALWITGSSAVVGDRTPYTILLRDSAGIEPGDRVRVAGVTVGRVQDVNLTDNEEWPVRIGIAIKPDIDIHRDAFATITSQGMLGENFLQVDPGTPNQPSLEANGTIASRPAMSLDLAMARLDEVSGKVSLLLDDASVLLRTAGGQLDEMLEGANAMLSSENAENLSALLATLRQTLDTAGPQLAELTTNLTATSEKMNAAFDDLPELTGRVNGLLASLDSALGPDGERLVGVLDAAQSGLISAEEAMAAISANRTEIDQSLADLRDTLSNLKSFSQSLKERPYSLVRVRHPADRKPGDGAGQ